MGGDDVDPGAAPGDRHPGGPRGNPLDLPRGPEVPHHGPELGAFVLPPVPECPADIDGPAVAAPVCGPRVTVTDAGAGGPAVADCLAAVRRS